MVDRGLGLFERHEILSSAGILVGDRAKSQFAPPLNRHRIPFALAWSSGTLSPAKGHRRSLVASFSWLAAGLGLSDG